MYTVIVIYHNKSRRVIYKGKDRSVAIKSAYNYSCKVDRSTYAVIKICDSKGNEIEQL